MSTSVKLTNCLEGEEVGQGRGEPEPEQWSMHGSKPEEAHGGSELGPSAGFAVCGGLLAGDAMQSPREAERLVAPPENKTSPSFIMCCVCTGSCHKGIALCDNQVALISLTELIKSYSQERV